MHFAVNKEHRDFFRKNLWLECEELLTTDELTKLSQAIEKALNNRLHLKSGRTHKLTPGQQFFAARDLWRDDPYIKKMVLSRILSGIGAELTEKRSLRIGYDMLFTTGNRSVSVDDSYEKLLLTVPSLLDISPLQGVVCGVVLSLDNSLDVPEKSSELFSLTPGNGIFFSPERPLPLTDLLKRQTGKYLMIVYVEPKCVCIRKELDPHFGAMQRLGYQLGDRLKDTLNPIVYP